MQDPEHDAPESVPPAPESTPVPAPPAGTPPPRGPVPRHVRMRRERGSWPAPHEGPVPLDLTRVLSLTFSTYFRNLPRLLLISLAVYAPLLIFGVVALTPVGWRYGGESMPGLLLAVDVLILHQLLTAALVHGVNRELAGGRLEVRAALQAAFSRAGSVVALGAIVVFGLLLAFGLLIVPGIYLVCLWCVAFPALMAEELGPRAALARSAKLTLGSRWPILALIGIIFFACYTLSSVAMTPLMILFTEGVAVLFLVGQIVLLFVRSLVAVVTTVIYHELRIGGEGLEIEQLGSVFD